MYPLLASTPGYPFFPIPPLSLSFLCILALASNHHSPSPNPISTLSYSFLLFARSLSLSLYLCLPFSPSLRLDRTFDSFGGNLQSSTLFLPPSPSLHPFFSSLLRPIHRVSTCSTLSYRSPSETYIPPTLTTLGLPPAGDDNNGNDLVLFHRIGI